MAPATVFAFNSYKRYVLNRHLIYLKARYHERSECSVYMQRTLDDSPSPPSTSYWQAILENKGSAAYSEYRYKAGTAKFSSWLAEAGKLCGGDVNNIEVAVPRLTGQHSNKKAYTIAIGHFITLAQTVADKVPKITVPRSILNLLSDVISLRKEVS
jgi:hypothetical protein